jgi:hypothetical protein
MLKSRLTGLLLVALALGACAPSQPEVLRPEGSATYPPTQFVEMLEAKPTRPYAEIAIIELSGEPGSFRAQVLAQIAERARQIGADAVILQDVSRTTPAATRLNPTTGMYDSTGGQIIPAFKGIAIKYR